MNDPPTAAEQPIGDPAPQHLTRPTRVLLASTVATPIVIGGASVALDRTAAVTVALITVAVLAGVVFWAVRHPAAP